MTDQMVDKLKMADANRALAAQFGLHFPRFLLPNPELDPSLWSVVACDQFTSQPEYWEEVRSIVGDAPSTLNLVLPEVYLESPGDRPIESRVEDIHQNMNEYLDNDVFQELSPGLIVIRRLTAQNRIRTGLVAAIDLDTYEFEPGNRALTRASEATVPDRIPPRLAVRKDAKIECAHILLLLDDPQQACIKPFAEQVSSADSGYRKLYDFELMAGAGHLTGWFVPSDCPLLNELLEQMARLSLYTDHQMMFAVGDGNHSLATAKASWDQLKKENPSIATDHPARYAMVEIEALNDPGLLFEPIHQVLFDTSLETVEQSAKAFYGNRLSIVTMDPSILLEDGSLKKERPTVPEGQVGIPVRSGDHFHLWQIKSDDKLAIEVLRDFLDPFMNEKELFTDYIHGDEVVTQLTDDPDNVGFYLPQMDPDDFFNQIIHRGILPRKAFSLGDAVDKRFYMECKAI